MRALRQYFSYANVVATLALVVALSGSAAAAGYVINSSGQIRNGAVTGQDVKDASLTGRDVKDGSLTAKDLRGPVPGTIDGVTAGGDLTGTYPDPQLNAGAVGTGDLAADTRGVAVAGVIVGPTGAVSTYFNRRGGAPTVTHTATGQFEIAFPGLTAWYPETAPVARLMSSSPGEVAASTTGGRFLVSTYSSAGVATDRWFVLLCYPMSPTG